MSATDKRMADRIDEELKKAGKAYGDVDMDGIPDEYEKTEEDKKNYEESVKVKKDQ